MSCSINAVINQFAPRPLPPLPLPLPGVLGSCLAPAWYLWVGALVRCDRFAYVVPMMTPGESMILARMSGLGLCASSSSASSSSCRSLACCSSSSCRFCLVSRPLGLFSLAGASSPSELCEFFSSTCCRMLLRLLLLLVLLPVLLLVSLFTFFLSPCSSPVLLWDCWGLGSDMIG
jgi:hypothetical protein